MATLNTPQNGKAITGRKPKAFPTVDLTAMVDLAFLLITFFMLTTSLSKMRAMDIAKPIPSTEFGEWPESRTMTILLGKNNQAVCFLGDASKAVMHTLPITRIREQILINKKLVALKHSDGIGKRLLVIVKPTNTSVYKNFVDIIDELNINGVETYAIDDKLILPQEKAFLLAKGI